jgi:hypothetical protein
MEAESCVESSVGIDSAIVARQTSLWNARGHFPKSAILGIVEYQLHKNIVLFPCTDRFPHVSTRTLKATVSQKQRSLCHLGGGVGWRGDRCSIESFGQQQ